MVEYNFNFEYIIEYKKMYLILVSRTLVIFVLIILSILNY